MSPQAAATRALRLRLNTNPQVLIKEQPIKTSTVHQAALIILKAIRAKIRPKNLLSILTPLSMSSTAARLLAAIRQRHSTLVDTQTTTHMGLRSRDSRWGTVVEIMDLGSINTISTVSRAKVDQEDTTLTNRLQTSTVVSKVDPKTTDNSTKVGLTINTLRLRRWVRIRVKEDMVGNPSKAAVGMACLQGRQLGDDSRHLATKGVLLYTIMTNALIWNGGNHDAM